MRLALIIAITIAILAPQQREAPSVVGASTFASSFGRFSIALPNPTRFGPLTIPTPFGNARGQLFQWETKEATFGVGYGDAAQRLDDGPAATKQVFDGATERFNKIATANNGNVGKVKQITLDKYQGIEQRVDLFTGTVIQRTYVVSRRVYEIVAVMKNTQQTYESVALGVLDSFKMLSEAEVKAKQDEELAKAEPSPLPQTPVPNRAGSDVTDEGLRGHVKTVVREQLSGTPPEQERQRDTYNPQGNLIRSESYDEKGNVSTIKVYGYLNGSRVSKFKNLTPPLDPLTLELKPSPGGKKPDFRFWERYDYKYDEKKRLTEQLTFLNDGELWLRTVYKYNGNQKERLDYTEDSRVGLRILYKLDDKGNEIESTVFNITGTARYKTSYTYEFDSNGNWTKQTATRVEFIDGREQPLPTIVLVRTITYY